MGAYRVARDYKAVYRSSAIGFDEGATADVDDEVAEWVNRDSPGTLVPVDAPKAKAEPTPDDADTEAPAEEPAPKPKRGGRRAST